MFSKEIKDEMAKKFHLTESIINSSKHYSIPKFIYKSRNKVNNHFKNPSNTIFQLQLERNPEILLNKHPSSISKISRTYYSENKRKNILKLMTKIQREKIDLLINRAYQKMNYNIRKYNKNIYPKRNEGLKLKPIPFITKECIIDHVMEQVQKYIPSNSRIINNRTEMTRNNNNFNNKGILNKQVVWSLNYLEDKKMNDYKKMYKLKYLAQDYEAVKDKLKKRKIKKDKSIPLIKRIKIDSLSPLAK